MTFQPNLRAGLMFGLSIDSFGVWLQRSVDGCPPLEVQMRWYYAAPTPRQEGGQPMTAPATTSRPTAHKSFGRIGRRCDEGDERVPTLGTAVDRSGLDSTAAAAPGVGLPPTDRSD